MVEIAEGRNHGRLEWPKLYLAEVSVLGQVDQQYHHQNEQDATLHRGLQLRMGVPLLKADVCLGKAGRATKIKKPATLFQATRLSLRDPWLSVLASRRVWLYLGVQPKHAFSQMSNKIYILLTFF